MRTAQRNREIARRARVAEITAAALTRQHLGQAAHHELLADGQHKVTVAGKTTVGATLAEAIDQAREARR
jgi:hypothetical protein